MKEAGIGGNGRSLARWDFWRRGFAELEERLKKLRDDQCAGLVARCAASLWLKEQNVGALSKERVAALEGFFQLAQEVLCDRRFCAFDLFTYASYVQLNIG